MSLPIFLWSIRWPRSWRRWRNHTQKSWTWRRWFFRRRRPRSEVKWGIKNEMNMICQVMSKRYGYLSHLKFHDVTACRCTDKACTDVPFFGVKLPDISGVLVVVKNFLVVAGPLLNLIRSKVIIFTGGQGFSLSFRGNIFCSKKSSRLFYFFCFWQYLLMQMVIIILSFTPN